MKNISDLVDGFRRFYSVYYGQRPELVERLVKHGQAPKVMVVACRDSRVDPGIVTDCDPGDLFVVRNVTRSLNEGGLKMMDPKTWPQQGRLAGIVKEFANEEDRRSYEAYKAWLKGGIEPDEYQKDESDRRAAALVRHGNAELTERAYPEIFGEK